MEKQMRFVSFRIMRAVLVTVLPLLLLAGCRQEREQPVRRGAKRVVEQEIPLRYACCFTMKKGSSLFQVGDDIRSVYCGVTN